LAHGSASVTQATLLMLDWSGLRYLQGWCHAATKLGTVHRSPAFTAAAIHPVDRCEMQVADES